jgi:hypothetical protein
MRRLVFPALLALSLAPGLAVAQSDDNAPPPPPPGADMPPSGGPDMPPPPGGNWHGKHHDWKDMESRMETRFKSDFAAANTTHDGHLTLAQAQAAKFRPVADHFADIDAQKRGYVTLNESEAWLLDDHAKHMEDVAQQMEQQAAALRAQPD